MTTTTSSFIPNVDDRLEVYGDGELVDKIGTITLSDGSNKVVINYTDVKVGDYVYSYLGLTIAYGDIVEYPAGSIVDGEPEVDELVDDLINDTSKTFEQKVEQFPKILGWNDELDHYERWDIVFDEEGQDTGKRINPDTQEEVQFDKEKMDSQLSHYLTLYNQNTKVIPR